MANQSGGSGDQKKKDKFNEMILGNIKPRSGKETTKWLSELTSEEHEEVLQASGVHNVSPAPLPAQFSHPSIAQTQVKWVDKLFDLFQQYEVEYNRAVQESHLRIETERATITPELISKMQGSDHFHYTGRLITRKWTMVIRGNLSSIAGYVIPSDHFIGFDNNISAYTQFFEFFPVWDGELKWSFGPGAFGMGQLPSVAKQLFGHVIKVAKGDADETETFSLGGSAKPALPPKPMGDDPFFKSSNSSSGGGASEFLVNHGGVFEDDKPVQTLADTSSSAQAKKPDMTQSQKTTQSNPKKNAVKTGSATHNEIELAVAADQLGRSVERELENLSRAGAKAFEDHDFAAVEKLMKRTAKIKNMRDQILGMIEELKRELTD